MKRRETERSSSSRTKERKGKGTESRPGSANLGKTILYEAKELEGNMTSPKKTGKKVLPKAKRLCVPPMRGKKEIGL